jgi:hypothetical protein
MPITCSAYVPKSILCLDLSDVRKTILAAAKRAAKTETHTKYDVALPVGKHTLKEPFRLSAKENPELKFLDITIRSEKPGMAEVNSLVRLDGKKFVKAAAGDYFTYDFMKEEGKIPLFRDLFLNYKHIPRARSRTFYNLDPITKAEREGTEPREGLWLPIDIARRMASFPLGTPEIMLFLEWYYAIFHVEGIDLARTRTEGGETYALAKIKEGELTKLKGLNPCIGIKGREMYVMNSPAFLTTNTYAYDYEKGVLYLDPENPDYIQYHAIEYPALDCLFALEGLSNLTLAGLTFYGTSSTYVCENVYFCNQANTIYSPALGRRQLQQAAVLARDMRCLTVTDCYFRDLGTNALQVVDTSVGVTVKNSYFENIAMGGILIGNPSGEWENPKNRTFRAHVENNYLSHIGYEYPSSIAIYFGQVDGVKILHNTVEDCAYSAISMGWTWSPAKFEPGERVNIREAEIAYNYFHNYMQLLKDGGAVYVLGGNADQRTTTERFNRMHDNFALLDTRKNEYGKYGYYCDGASSHWEISHSVVLNNEQMPIFSQPHLAALSYHNHFVDIYANTVAHPSAHVPKRDVLCVNYVYDDLPPEEYLAKHPEAKRIRDAAGCTLYL